MGEWLVPFGGRNGSGSYNLNFLWRSGSLYVMDNHLGALWCWWQHLSEAPKWNLLHVDRHYDALSSQLELWLPSGPSESSTLPEYLAATYDSPGATGIPVMRWDNYLSLFLAMHSERVVHLYTATPEDGDRPVHPEHVDLNPWELADLVETIGTGEGWPIETPWLVNVDLDYFTFVESHELKSRMFDVRYVGALGGWLRQGVDRGAIRCLTLALSPETTGSWDAAEELMQTLLASFDEVPAF